MTDFKNRSETHSLKSLWFFPSVFWASIVSPVPQVQRSPDYSTQAQQNGTKCEPIFVPSRVDCYFRCCRVMSPSLTPSFTRLGPLIPKCEIRMIGRRPRVRFFFFANVRLNHDLFFKIECRNSPRFRSELCEFAPLNSHNLLLLLCTNEMGHHNGRQQPANQGFVSKTRLMKMTDLPHLPHASSLSRL